MVEVPTKAEFDALAAQVTDIETRVAAIEALIEQLKTALGTVVDMLYPSEG